MRTPRLPSDFLLLIGRFLGVLLIFSLISILIQFIWPFLQEIPHLIEEIASGQNKKVLYIGGFAYGIALAVPFLPGVEIGAALMLLYGAEGILYIYLCSVFGLNLAFFIGKKMPRKFILAIFRKKVTEPSKIDDRLSVLSKKYKWFHHVRRNKVIAMIIVLNLPGNFILGGGGGISMLCGMDRRFTWYSFLLVSVLAPSFLPILMALGVITFESMVEFKS